MNDHPVTPSDSAPFNRRAFLTTLAQGTASLALGATVLPALAAQPAPKSTTIVVYKDPGCGCCKEWVKHMQKAGFTVTSHDTADMDSIKSSMGVPDSLASCHTAVVGTYVFEGHVPADLVKKFLAEKPVARGLAVPGMPAGSPGMEGSTKSPYNIILFERSGKTRVYASR